MRSLQTGNSNFSTVTATLASLASSLGADSKYVIVSSTNTYVRQGTAKKVTCATQANMTDGDYITVTLRGTAVVYEFDKSGNGVTAGRTAIDISGDTTAAEVAASAVAIIAATQTGLRATDHSDGTFTIDAADTRDLTVTENVAHASFTVAAGVMQASAAAGSAILPASTPFVVEGVLGAQVGVLRVSADGAATLMVDRIA